MQQQNFEEEIDLVEYLIIILKHRWKITAIVLISVLFSIIYSITRPPMYESNATFFCLDSIRGNEEGTNIPKSNISEDLVVSILKSREMLDSIINELNLMKIWNAKSFAEIRDKLTKSTKISFEKGGIIKVSVITDKPELSRDIANLYVSKIDEFNKNLELSVNASLIQIVDRAVLPENRMPRGTEKNALIAFTLSLFFSIFLVFFLEMLKKNDVINRLNSVIAKNNIPKQSL